MQSNDSERAKRLSAGGSCNWADRRNRYTYVQNHRPKFLPRSTFPDLHNLQTPDDGLLHRLRNHLTHNGVLWIDSMIRPRASENETYRRGIWERLERLHLWEPGQRSQGPRHPRTIPRGWSLREKWTRGTEELQQMRKLHG